MVILDISAVNVALPDLASDLNIPHSDIGWTITSYSLIFGSLLLFGGRAADLLGRRRVFLTGLAVFTASLARHGARRRRQHALRRPRRPGPGRRDALPAALSIITSTFHGPERARRSASGARSAAQAPPSVSCSAACSPSSSTGARSSSSTCPSASSSPPAPAHLLPADAARPQWRGLDLRGALLATASLGALVYALSQAQSSGWTSTQTLGIGAAGLAGLAAFAALELRTAPLLRVQRLADRAAAAASR